MKPGQSSSELRLIGQDLEALELRDFKVEVADGVYRVSGTAMQAPSEDPAPTGGLSRFWRRLTRGGILTDQPRPVEIDRTYGPDELKSVKLRVVDQRSDLPEKSAPDSYSPSQILRVIGAFVDSKEGEFVSFSRHGRMVRIGYRNSSGELRSEEQPFSQLLDFSHYMYRQRQADGG